MRRILPMLAAALLVAALVPATASSQIPTATLSVNGSPLGEVWPNGGSMQVLAFGWGGVRPKPLRELNDSLAQYWSGVSVPVLTIQKRVDIFSPLLDEVLETATLLPDLTLLVNTIEGSTLEYSLRNVRIVGIRSVGHVFPQTPATREIVFVFEELAVGP